MKHFEEIEKIGKRTPYGVPEGFHEELKQRIMATVQPQRTRRVGHKRALRLALWGGGLVAAAAVALALTVATSEPTPAEAFDRMLAQLTDEQCNSLVASYNSDIFLLTLD